MFTCIIIKKRTIVLFIITILLLITIVIYKQNFIGSHANYISGNDEIYIAVIIDDFGNNQEGTKLFKNMPIPFTAAIMPNLEKSTEESIIFSENNDIILHLPMEPKTGKTSWLGKNPITTSLSSEKIREIILNDINQLHNVIGINNHMGSKAMESEKVLREIFYIAKEYDLIIIDSKTTNSKLAKNLAKEYGVSFFERDVFLDGTNKDVKKNLLKGVKIAKNKGYAVLIGHVGNAGGNITANTLLENYKDLQNNKIKFVTITQLNEIIKNNSLK